MLSTVCLVRCSACYPSGVLVQSIACGSCFCWSACCCAICVQVVVLLARVCSACCFSSVVFSVTCPAIACQRIDSSLSAQWIVFSACCCLSVLFVQLTELPLFFVLLVTHLLILSGRCSPVRLAGLSGFLIVGLSVWPGQGVCFCLCLFLSFPVGNVVLSLSLSRSLSFSVSFPVGWLSSFVPVRHPAGYRVPYALVGVRRCGRAH